MNITGFSVSNATSLRDQFQAFKKGNFTLQKTDLTDLKNSLGTNNAQASTGIDALLGAFDKIDKNQDGISFQELMDFTKANAPTGATDGGSVQGKCRNCKGCGACGQGVAQASDPRSDPVGGTQGPEGNRRADGKGLEPKYLPPVTKDDLVAYQTLLQKEGKEVPQALTDFIAGFDSVDSNKDGKVEFSEFKIYLKQIAPKPPDAVPGAVAGVTKDDLSALKDQLSQDSQQALLGINNLLSGFETADTNKDGKINPDELQAFLKSASREHVASQADQLKTMANGLDIFAMLNRKSQNPNDENPQSKPSKLFLEKLVSRYGQYMSAPAAANLQIKA